MKTTLRLYKEFLKNAIICFSRGVFRRRNVLEINHFNRVYNIKSTIMKRRFQYSLTFLISAFTIISFVSCEKDDDVKTNFEPKVVLSYNSQSVPNTTSEQTVEVLTNEAWQVESNVDWINLSESSGEKGRFTLTFSVAENEDDERTGVLTFSNEGGASAEFEVIQEAGNRDDIYVKINGTGDGYSWAEATTLDNALELAVTGNTIHIAEGTYVPTMAVSGGTPSNEANKTFEISSNITLRGGYPEDATEGAEPDHSQYLTTLSGEKSSYHVVTVSAPVAGGEEKVVIQGLTISGGFSERSVSTSVTINGTEYPDDYGGGIIIGGGVVDIIDSEIVDNEAGTSAGIYAFNGSVLNMERSKLNNNIAEHHNGGVWMRSNTKLTIYDSEIRGNQSGGVGGGIYAYDGSEVAIYNSVIADNKAGNHGGGLYVRANTTGNLVNVIIANNSTDGTGGGIFMYDNSALNIVSSTITQNSTSRKGGGVYGRSGTNSVNIYNSIISGNEQGSGTEIDEADSGALIRTFQGSAIENVVYGENGQTVDGVSFNAGSMQDTGDRIYLPIGEDNPALNFGLSAASLIQVGENLEPVVEEEIIANDLFHNSRTNLNTMGAVVDDE
jgi:hypothetical protein